MGESYYQENLEKIAGPKTQMGKNFETVALLVPEEHNPHDANSVAITIGSLKVGHLAKAHAFEYRKYLGSKIGRCGALIVGGWKNDADEEDDQTEGSYGVKLKLNWPPTLKSDQVKVNTHRDRKK
ncbi:MAG: hypothetical protein KGO53_12675 [Alphaproteobacteria bacterium]|nr:hypothetical protein [Alphaproteobacteria bacterium]